MVRAIDGYLSIDFMILCREAGCGNEASVRPVGEQSLEGFRAGAVEFPISRQKAARYGAPAFATGQDTTSLSILS
jgi:hypothetical protein